jgi:hypothetical protein
MKTLISEKGALEPTVDKMIAFCEGEEGVLLANGEHVVFPFSNTAEASAGISRWIEWAALCSLPEGDLAPLLGARFCLLNETLNTQNEIVHLARELQCEEQIELPQTPLPSIKSEGLPINRPKTVHTTQTDSQKPKVEPPKVFNSLFSLAKSVHSENAARSRLAKVVQQEGRKEIYAAPTPTKSEMHASSISSQKSDEHEHEDGEGKGQQQQDQQEQEKEKERPRTPFGFLANKKKKPGIQAMGAKQSMPSFCTYHAENTPVDKSSAQGVINGVGSLYFRFMALMSRILGQAEAESHQLYQRIKARTDQVDVLIKLQSKINNSKGEIDWTKDEEGQKLLDAARAIGVDIPKDKLKWKVEEIPLLKENISMRKDSMEKITQLERTDMQRYLQEASQCHQARSNILKLMKEVGDTFVHNMRP